MNEIDPDYTTPSTDTRFMDSEDRKNIEFEPEKNWIRQWIGISRIPSFAETPINLPVQTVNLHKPLINTPYRVGQMAASAALSTIYARGANPVTATFITGFSARKIPKKILFRILDGGKDKIRESGAYLVGGQGFYNETLQCGFSVTGSLHSAAPSQTIFFRPGDRLMVTRPLGNAVLASAVYAKYKEPERYEQLLYQWGSKLEELAAKVIRRFHLPPAICIGNRGLIGQILDQIGETDIRIEIELEKIPFLPEVVNVAEMGLIPAETFVKKEIYESRIEISRAQNLLKVDLLFVSQSSGELLLVIPPEKENAILKLFEEEKQLARIIGRVYPAEGKKGILTIV